MTRQPTEKDLLELLSLLRVEQNPRTAAIMLDDLVWSSERLDPGVRARAIIHASGIMAAKRAEPAIANEIFLALDTWPVLGKRTVDVAVVTVKESEFDAAKVAFGVEIDRTPDFYRRGAYFFNFQLDRKSKSPLSGIVTKCGVAGNNPMAAFLHTVFSEYDVRLCCLVGMAAGAPKQVNLGDVVFADKVVDYGRKIATVSGDEVDPVTYTPDIAIAREFANFRPIRHEWYEIIARKLASATPKKWDFTLPEGFDPARYQPVLRHKSVLAGDILVEDNTVEAIGGTVGPPRRTGALEMEGAGFAATCVEANVPWLVVRGIADMGAVDGENRPKEWQFLSTLAAGTALRLWLESCGFYA